MEVCLAVHDGEPEIKPAISPVVPAWCGRVAAVDFGEDGVLGEIIGVILIPAEAREAVRDEAGDDGGDLLEGIRVEVDVPRDPLLSLCVTQHALQY